MHQIPCRAAMNSVEWNPRYNLLAYAGDDKNKYQADEGNCSFLLYQADVQVLFVNFIYLLFLIAGVFRIFGFESP